MGFGTRPMKDGYDRLPVFDHVAVKFHHFPLLPRAEQEDGHAGGVRVPNLSPACNRLVGQLTDGHVWNHGG